jgi:hypothetical protein
MIVEPTGAQKRYRANLVSFWAFVLAARRLRACEV